MSDFDPARGGEQPGLPQPPPPAGYPPPAYGAPGYGPPGYPVYGAPYGYPAAYAPPGPPGQMPSSNIGWAIASLLLFWPLAIPSFIFSSRVESYWFQGNVAGAQKASHDARLYGLIGVIVGAVVWVITLVIILFAFVFLAHTVDQINDHLPTFTPPS